MRFEVNLSRAEASAREARDLIDQEIGDRMPAVSFFDLLTIVNELVSNAARFGEGEILVCVDLGSDGAVSGAVENIGSAAVEPSSWSGGTEGHGLGLRIVDALADRWWVERNGTTRVAFTLEAD